jgi:hypothetical protein
MLCADLLLLERNTRMLEEQLYEAIKVNEEEDEAGQN